MKITIFSILVVIGVLVTMASAIPPQLMGTDFDRYMRGYRGNDERECIRYCMRNARSRWSRRRCEGYCDDDDDDRR